MRRSARAGVVLGGTAIALVALATEASANWTSYFTGVPVGTETRRWTDESYTQIHFERCEDGIGVQGENGSTKVRLYRVVNNSPDVGYDEKTFTECFQQLDGDGDVTSSGSWSGLPYSAATLSDGEYIGGYYVRITAISGYTSTSGPYMSVSRVIQDSTLAD